MDEQTQAAIQELVMKALQGDQKSAAQVQEIIQTGEIMKKMIAQAQQQSQQQAPQQAQRAKNGAKLEYIKYLRGECPEGYEMKYFKAGGKMCKKCMRKKAEGGQMPNDPITAYKEKCGGKMKKKK